MKNRKDCIELVNAFQLDKLKDVYKKIEIESLEDLIDDEDDNTIDYLNQQVDECNSIEEFVDCVNERGTGDCDETGYNDLYSNLKGIISRLN